MTNRHMTEADERRVVMLIETWTGPKITWDSLMGVIQKRFGVGWTYPTLTKRPAIVESFENTKARLKGSPKPTQKIDDAENEQLKAALAAKDEEIKKLRDILARYDERFARYVYNAHALANLTPEALGAPLSDLGRSGNWGGRS